jgi:lipoate-protein ligase A
MAIDQALLESVDPGTGPVLRLYTWSRPTLSLGYFQSLADRQAHRESVTLECVRRATGGGAIVHDRELTYSLAVPLQGSATGPRLDLYRQTHLAFIEALRSYGVRTRPFGATEVRSRSAAPAFLCFQRREQEDLILSGYKVLGSAQRKTRSAVLQHGSLLLRASPWAPQLPGIHELTSQPIPPDELAERFAQRLTDLLSIRWIAGQLSASEHRRAAVIEADKFAADRWRQRR